MQENATTPTLISATTDSTDVAQVGTLTGMITRAAAALARATTSAEVLDVIYDAAQERGEIARYSAGNPQIVQNKNDLPRTAAEVGLSNKIMHEARKVRDAERENLGIVRETLDEQLRKGEAPTRAHIKRAITPKRTVAAATLNTFAPGVVPPETAADDDEEAEYDEEDALYHRRAVIGYALDVSMSYLERIERYVEERIDTQQEADAIRSHGEAWIALAERIEDLIGSER